MSAFVWIVLSVMWAAIAVSAVPLWRDRAKVWDRPVDRASYRTMVGVTIAAALVGFILTAFAVGYSYGKARALADNLADEKARARAERLPAGPAESGPEGR